MLNAVWISIHARAIAIGRESLDYDWVLRRLFEIDEQARLEAEREGPRSRGACKAEDDEAEGDGEAEGGDEDEAG